MGLSKAFSVGEILTADDVNEHLAHRQKIQTGAVQISMGGNSAATANVEFPEPFTGSGPVTVTATYGDPFTSPRLIPGAYGATTAGFTAQFYTADGTTHGGTRTLTWLAIQDY